MDGTANRLNTHKAWHHADTVFSLNYRFTFVSLKTPSSFCAARSPLARCH